MAYQLSPGINVSEIDLTTVIPSSASSSGAFAGEFTWGPIDEIVDISDEVRMVERFGKPTNENYEYWFTAANFLAYSGSLKTVRAANTVSTLNAMAGKYKFTSVSVSEGGLGYSNSFVLVTDGLYSGNAANISITVAQPSGNIVSAVLNNPTTVGIYDYIPNVVFASGSNARVTLATTNVTSNSALIKNDTDWETNFASGSNGYGVFSAKYAGTLGNSITVSLCDSEGYARWAYKNLFTSAPGTSSYALDKGASFDELHIVVIDNDGKISGTKGTILEKYSFVSKASDAKTESGNTNYYKNVIANQSKYIRWLTHPKTVVDMGLVWGSAAVTGTYSKLSSDLTVSLFGGNNGVITTGNIMTAYDKFDSSEDVDIAFVLSGPADQAVALSLIDMVESRKDAIVFISPRKDDVVDNYGSEVDSIITYRNSLGTSTYAFMDSGWKYQYDKYNDVYRWIPLNGDIAGLCARNDLERDPWVSPGGATKGLIKNVIKLAWNPRKNNRDTLYQYSVNPVVTFTGEGPMLYGDKTLTLKPSAFDRINVRRLFIVLEGSIKKASRYSLFEFNDQFTRAQFINMVEPFLRDVQGRRGIVDFRVVCDDTNNTGEVIDRNEFVGDIYIKPSRSINFIQLNFIAVKTDVNFSEIVGQF